MWLIIRAKSFPYDLKLDLVCYRRAYRRTNKRTTTRTNTSTVTQGQSAKNIKSNKLSILWLMTMFTHYLPHSSDLAPSYFHLFGPQSESLGDIMFKNDEDVVQHFVQKFLQVPIKN